MRIAAECSTTEVECLFVMHSAMRGRMLILEGSYAESFKPGSSVTLLILHFIEYFSRKQSIQFRIGLLIYVILVKNFFCFLFILFVQFYLF
jgi:hypothetical protein